MRIQHNIMAMNAYRNYNTNTKALSGNLEKLSSGYKINRAGDDAAGLAISEKMRAQITGLDAAQKNVKDGISLVKTAEGAMQEIQDMLNRMDYLATQSANGTYQDEVDRENLQKEVENLKTEINRIADSANFNGIKLLDGSLASKGAANKIVTGGNVASKASEGAKGVFVMDTAIAAGTGAAPGGTAQFTVSTDDGTAYTVKFTVGEKDGDSTKPGYLIAEDGTKYKLAKEDGSVSQDELTGAITAELGKTAFGEKYTMAATSGKITFTAKEAGTDTPAIVSVDIQADYAATGTAYTVHTAMNLDNSTAARDAGREIDKNSINLYNGQNYDDAVFTINGKKFVVMANISATDLGKDGADMNATVGLGNDVTILISDGTGKGIDSTDANFVQNCKKITEVTGLAAGECVKEAGTDNSIDTQGGIRLTIDKKAAGKGLTLQIGDTADKFNQMQVFVGDMHTKALGIDDIDIGNQDGAAAAIQTIKNAINQVSSVRGDLGAVQNRLEHTGNNLSVMAENIQDAESTIRDTDVANEMMSYVKNNILVQSAQAMLAQANQVPQGVLQLLG